MSRIFTPTRLMMALLVVTGGLVLAGCSTSSTQTSLTEEERLNQAIGNELVQMDSIAETANQEVLGITDSLE